MPAHCLGLPPIMDDASNDRLRQMTAIHGSSAVCGESGAITWHDFVYLILRSQRRSWESTVDWMQLVRRRRDGQARSSLHLDGWGELSG